MYKTLSIPLLDVGDPAVSHQERDASLLQRQSRVQQHGLHQVQQQDSPKTDSHGLDFSTIQTKVQTPVIPKHAANCLFCDSKFLFKKVLQISERLSAG